MLFYLIFIHELKKITLFFLITCKKNYIGRGGLVFPYSSFWASFCLLKSGSALGSRFDLLHLLIIIYWLHLFRALTQEKLEQPFLGINHILVMVHSEGKLFIDIIGQGTRWNFYVLRQAGLERFCDWCGR